MRHALPLLTATAILIATGAYAAEMSGDIKSMDSKARTMTLMNGQMFEVPKSVDMDSLNTAERVKVTYHQSHGKHMATRIVPE
ncbi:DUF1344 domain-containing protein [Rhizobiaceae sp. 2RAB30]